MLGLPHPLLSDNVDIHGVVRRAGHLKENTGTPAEHHHHEEKRHNGPSDFKRQCSCDFGGAFVLRAAPVLDGKDKDKGEDQGTEKHCYNHQVDGQVIHVDGSGGGLLGQQLELRIHRWRALASPDRAVSRSRWMSRRQSQIRIGTKIASVKTPARRTMFRTMAEYFPVLGS